MNEGLKNLKLPYETKVQASDNLSGLPDIEEEAIMVFSIMVVHLKTNLIMSIKIGNGEIKSLYKGTTSITGVYKGSTKIYPNVIDHTVNFQYRTQSTGRKWVEYCWATVDVPFDLDTSIGVTFDKYVDDNLDSSETLYFEFEPGQTTSAEVRTGVDNNTDDDYNGTEYYFNPNIALGPVIYGGIMAGVPMDTNYIVIDNNGFKIITSNLQ